MSNEMTLHCHWHWHYTCVLSEVVQFACKGGRDLDLGGLAIYGCYIGVPSKCYFVIIYMCH